MKRLVAIDPGLKPGAVELEWGTGRVLQASHRLERWVFETPWTIAATEGQWYFGDEKAKTYTDNKGRKRVRTVDVNDLLSLAFRAGFTLACIPAERSLRLPPRVWRQESKLSKEQMQQGIAKTLTVGERRLFRDIPKSCHSDVLDAIGIGRAALRLAPTTREYDYSLPIQK
jgi:hypothetical protein